MLIHACLLSANSAIVNIPIKEPFQVDWLKIKATTTVALLISTLKC